MVERSPRRLAVILHADVAGSTRLVQLDETVAHERIRDAFGRCSETIRRYEGVAHEIRGDALVAEFARASDAVSAALAFQEQNRMRNGELADGIRPEVRVGTSGRSASTASWRTSSRCRTRSWRRSRRSSGSA
jgi:class 3 adenylate cyclase